MWKDAAKYEETEESKLDMLSKLLGTEAMKALEKILKCCDASVTTKDQNRSRNGTAWNTLYKQKLDFEESWEYSGQPRKQNKNWIIKSVSPEFLLEAQITRFKIS